MTYMYLFTLYKCMEWDIQSNIYIRWNVDTPLLDYIFTFLNSPRVGEYANSVVCGLSPCLSVSLPGRQEMITSIYSINYFKDVWRGSHVHTLKGFFRV